MNALRQWWNKRQLDKATALIESYGLSIVNLKEVGSTTYLVKSDGSYLKLVRGRK